MQHNEDKNCFLLPDESNEGAADRTVEDTMVVTVPVKWHTCKSDNNMFAYLWDFLCVFWISS